MKSNVIKHARLRANAGSSSPGHTARTMIALIALALPLAVSLSLLGPACASAISRDTVLARGQDWVNFPVKYSQAKRHLGYRTDCSGYVSMCWKTGTSWSTSTFHSVTRRIAKSQLAPGDALLKKGYHIRLFYGWVDDAHTQYVAYEANTVVAVCRIHSISEDMRAGYAPVRYKRISNSPRPANVLQNGSFDVWARSWGGQAEQPVWWQTSRSWWQTLATHRKDTYRSARNSLQLVNPSGYPANSTELSQSARVAAGANYRLSAWAKTTNDPRGLELRLVYLNAAGASVAETGTTGYAASINGSAFKGMSVLLPTPADAVKAIVTLRLAGATTTDTAGAAVTGSSVVIDDVSLVRQ